MALIPLFGESIAGVENKLPTYDGIVNVDQVNDNLGTAGGIVLSRIGTVGDVPPTLVDLASKVIEYGAAGLTEQQNFPEQSTATNSRGNLLWAQFEDLLERLVAGVEAAGGEPNVETRPAFNFAPPWMIQYMEF
jgi:hypothetical protein